MTVSGRGRKVSCILVLCLLVAFILSGCGILASPPLGADSNPGITPEPGAPGGEVPGGLPGADAGAGEGEGAGSRPAGEVPPANEPPKDDPGQGSGGETGDGDGEAPEPSPEEPIIYIGQVLKFPGGGEAPAESRVVSRGLLSGDKKEVAITFDSGWLYENTLPLLNILDDYGIKATFFPRALWVYNPRDPKNSYPDLAREIVKRGHTMGNHSLTHPDMTKLSPAEVRHELRESTRLIQEATGVRPFLFRPPYGAYNAEVLKALAEEGYPYTIMWTVDTHDWAEEIRGQKVTADYIVERVLGKAAGGGIVLMHVGGDKTVEALPRIIEELRERGYSFITVDRMVPAPGGPEIFYTVQKGDTLYSLARHYSTTVAEIIAYNNL